MMLSNAPIFLEIPRYIQSFCSVIYFITYTPYTTNFFFLSEIHRRNKS